MQKLLCQPFKIGAMELKNRMVMPPMVTRYATADGFVTKRTVNYYEARAKGGIGLIIVEATYVHEKGPLFPSELGLSDDKFISGMKELTGAVHGYGAKIAIQLVHGGRMTAISLSGVQPVAPSAIAAPGGDKPREITVPKIKEIVKAFAAAAVRAKKAGFDGVEIHGAHGYLIDQFISPLSNHRRDAYGGSVENRARLLIEVIKAVKEAAGPDFSVWCRINGKEYGVEDGETLEDAKKVAAMAEAAGAAAIHVSAGGPANPANTTTPVFKPAVIADLAAGIKEAVRVPVIAVGRMTPEAGEKLLEEGKADFIAFGRALFADPELPNKTCAGKLGEIRPCILCMRCRDDLRHSDTLGIRCTVGAPTGREEQYTFAPAGKPKRVLVVGGGPAGMEAARVAATRGHKVTLWEKESYLGGQMMPAAIAPHKDRAGALTDYFTVELKNLGVNVKLRQEATTEKIKKIAPDALVVATGVNATFPEIPGLKEAHAVMATDVLQGKARAGSRVVIIGGELVACEVAEYLAGKGKKVTMMRRGAEIAANVGLATRIYLMKRLQDEGVTMLTNISYDRATDKGIEITTKTGQKKLIEADTIVIAAGAAPNQTLYHEIMGKVPELYQIGDCVTPRNIAEAIREGYVTGTMI